MLEQEKRKIRIVAFRCEMTNYEKLKKTAKKQKIEISELIRKILAEYFEKK